MPSKKLTSYLIELSDDPVKLQEFYDDRETALGKSGLNQKHRKMLQENDLAAVTEIVKQESGKALRWTMFPINRPLLP